MQQGLNNGFLKEKKIKFSDKNKQKCLIDFAKAQGLSADTLIGKEYVPNENDPTILKRYCQNFNVIEPYYRDNRFFLFDSTKIKATISNVQFLMYPIKTNEIKPETRKTTDGTILYRTIDGAYLPFSKNQYRRYLTQNVKTIYIIATLEIKTSPGVCGVGIEIER